jgi:hypothetical protein
MMMMLKGRRTWRRWRKEEVEWERVRIWPHVDWLIARVPAPQLNSGSDQTSSEYIYFFCLWVHRFPGPLTLIDSKRFPGWLPVYTVPYFQSCLTCN